MLKRWVQGVEIEGLEHLQAGPKLVLMNHSSVFDPFLLNVFARRPVQFLITEPAMGIGAPP